VLIVSLPTVRWADVEGADLPHIDALVERSAVASMSVRTIGPVTDLGAAYATIGAGNRAGAHRRVAGESYEPGFPLEWGDAAGAFERRTREPANGAVLHLGMPEVVRDADRKLYGAEPGALGQAVTDAGLATAVVGYAGLPERPGTSAADTGAGVTVPGAPDAADAPDDPPAGGAESGGAGDAATGVEASSAGGGAAALAVADRAGRVEGGAVSPDLLVRDQASPYGARLDPEAVADAAGTALERDGVVLVEDGDLARLDAYRPSMTDDAYDDAFDRALARADDLVGRLTGMVDPERDLVVLVAPVSPGAATRGKEQLTAFAMAGPLVEPGLARSGTTRRAGYVTLPDVAPTVLDHLDIDLPDAMNGTAITSDGSGAPTAATIDGLVGDNEVAVFRDSAVGPVSVVYIVLQVVVYGLAVLALLRPRHRPRLGRLALGGALVVLAIPVVGFLSGLFPYDDLNVGAYTVVVLVAATGLGALAWLLGARHLLGPPLLLVGLTLAVMLGDVATGGHLQINTVFGYSPIVAGRFAGFGNLSFALTAISAIVVATGVWALPRMHGRRGRVDESMGRRGWPLAVAAVILGVTLAFDGLPSIGSDVGGVLAAGPAFAVVLLLLAGVPIDRRRLVAIALGTVAVLGAFAALDLARPADQRTHLGRFVESLTDGGAGTVVGRKLESNVSILTSSVWTWLVPIGLAFVAFLTWRSRGLLQRLQDRVPGLRACLVGGLVAAILGLAVNDSGVAIPAMMFGVALPYLSFLVLRTVARPVPADEAEVAAGPGGADGGPGARGRDAGGGGAAAAGGGQPGGDPRAERSGDAPDRRAGEPDVTGGTSSAGVR
jgi:hypothetical protein